MTFASHCRLAVRLIAIGAGTAVSASSAYAACNLIPGTSLAFNAELGATNRPFAAPGETVDLSSFERQIVRAALLMSDLAR